LVALPVVSGGPKIRSKVATVPPSTVPVMGRGLDVAVTVGDVMRVAVACAGGVVFVARASLLLAAVLLQAESVSAARAMHSGTVSRFVILSFPLSASCWC